MCRFTKILFALLFPYLVFCQDIAREEERGPEVGIRIDFPVLGGYFFLSEQRKDVNSFQSIVGNLVLGLNLGIGTKLNKFLNPEVRAGARLDYIYDGSFGYDASILIKSYFIEKIYGALAFSYYGVNGFKKETVSIGGNFKLVGVAFGLKTGRKTSLEVLLLKTLNERLGSRFDPPDNVERPVKLNGVLRVSFGFAWRI